MLKKRYILTACFVFTFMISYAQVVPPDTTSVDESLAIDTLDYDALFEDFVDFLDSLTAPRSFFLIDIAGNSSYFNYKRSADKLATDKQIVITPTLGYYHKSGPGITLSGNFTDYGQKRKWYQLAISPSFDFIQNRNWAAGFSYTRYITKDSLPFYTTPLQNEVNAYFIWRKPWIQPGIAVSYGRGSRSDLKKRERYIRLLLLRRLDILSSGDTTITTESIEDFSVTTSLRHNFYWLNIFGSNDYIRFTPMLSFSAGTQRYGFNQTTSTYYTVRLRKDATNVFYNTGDLNLDNALKFQALSLTLYLRPEYVIGKFFIQPQVVFDYYIPADDKKVNTLFSVNAGFMF